MSRERGRFRVRIAIVTTATVLVGALIAGAILHRGLRAGTPLPWETSRGHHKEVRDAARDLSWAGPALGLVFLCMAGTIGRAAGGRGKPTDGRVLARLAGLAALVVVGAGGHAAWGIGRTVSKLGRHTTPHDLSEYWMEISNALGVGGLVILVGLVASGVLGRRDRRAEVLP